MSSTQETVALETLNDTDATNDPQPAKPSRWSEALAVLRDAVVGSEQDYTSAPLGRAVILLAVPMVLETLMEALFALCDVAFVARLGVDAVATVGLTEAVLSICYAVATGLAVATTAMVARRIGEQRAEQASSTALQAIAVAVAVWLCLGVPGAVFAPDILRLMGGSPALVHSGTPFTRIMLGGSLTIVLLFVINAAFRGAGNAALAMRTLWLANAVNIVLDPCLIFGLGPFPRLGVTGAAVATTIGRAVGVLYQVTVLLGGRGRLHLDVRELRLRLDVMLRLLRLSFGGVLQFLISTTSWVALVRLLGGFGSGAVAGYTVAIRLVIFALLPAWGLSNAAATLMGQNLGAGRVARAERAVWTASAYNVAFLLLVAVCFIAGAEPIIGLLSSDPEVLTYGAECLRVISYGYAFYALGMVVVQALNGAGDTFTPTAINLGCYWLFQLPLAYALAHSCGMGPRGVFVAVPIAEALMTTLAVTAFRRGAWKNREV